MPERLRLPSSEILNAIQRLIWKDAGDVGRGLLSSVLRQWKFDGESRSQVQLALTVNASAMNIDDLFYCGEAQASSLDCSDVARPVKSIEHIFLIGRGNANPVVRDADQQ